MGKNQVDSKKSLKVLVLGDKQVGKSAFIVRYLTRKFIGEYDSSSEFTYEKEVTFAGSKILMTICDSLLPENDKDDVMLKKKLQTSDACIVVYDVTNYRSFVAAKNIASKIRSSQMNSNSIGVNLIPILMVATKSDLEHLRQVSTSEGQIATSSIIFCHFAESSSATCYLQVQDCFRHLFRLVNATSLLMMTSQPRRKSSTISQVKQKVFSRNKVVNNRPQIPKFATLRSQPSMTTLPLNSHSKMNPLVTVGDRINSLATVGERLAHEGCTTPMVECFPFKNFESLLDDVKSSSLDLLPGNDASSKTLPSGSAPPSRRHRKSAESDSSSTASSWWRRRKKSSQEGKSNSVGSRESSGCESLISLGELSLPDVDNDAVFSRAEHSKLNRKNLSIDLKNCSDVTDLPCKSAPPMRDFEKVGKHLRFFSGKFPQMMKRREGKGMSLRETVGEIMKNKRNK